jgi:hypothetical protein
MESGDIIEHMQEKEMYKYLGHLQALQIRHKTETVIAVYTERLTDTLVSHLSGRSMFEAINKYLCCCCVDLLHIQNDLMG